jgi:hypothetical protein
VFLTIKAVTAGFLLQASVFNNRLRLAVCGSLPRFRNSGNVEVSPIRIFHGTINIKLLNGRQAWNRTPVLSAAGKVEGKRRNGCNELDGTAVSMRAVEP